MTCDEPLKNLCFVFTGELSIDRSLAQSRVILLGGRVTKQPSSKTDYLVAGDEPGPSKLRKAVALKIKILNEAEFLDMIAKYENYIQAQRNGVDNGKNDDVNQRRIDVGDNDSMEKPDADANNSTNNNLDGRIICPREDKNIGRNNENSKTAAPIGKKETETVMWTEKYRPKSENDFVGNKTNISRLRDFLLGKLGTKAVLLSGNPGIGKTTAAYFVSNELNYDIIEFNASDVRNKRELEQKVKGLTDYLSIFKSNTAKDDPVKDKTFMCKKVIIMDEIDGMTSDRGGIAELTNIIKLSKVPIICICNDRTSMKIKTLSNHCTDLRFRKLDERQILPRVKHILRQEQVDIKEPLLREIIHNSSGDLRYVLNALQSMAKVQGASQATTIHHSNLKLFQKKILAKNVFDCVSEIFSKKPVSEKIDIYFEDYDMIPLMVQENYVKAKISLSKAAEASECISFSDIIDKRIRGSQDWNLLPAHAVFSSIIPTDHTSSPGGAHEKHFNKRTADSCGTYSGLTTRIDFTQYLGKLSKMNSNKRCLFESSIRGRILASSTDLRCDVLDLIYAKYFSFMVTNRIKEAIDLFVYLNVFEYAELFEILNKDDKEISRSSKSALTRGINNLIKERSGNFSLKRIEKSI